MYHPYHSSGQPENLGAEYIELCNNSTSPVDLTDWALTGGVDFVFPDLTLAAGDWVVVAADVTVFDHLYPGIDAVVGPWSGHLSNRGEAIVLRDNHNRIIDQVEYADQGDWAQRILGASGPRSSRLGMVGTMRWRWLFARIDRGGFFQCLWPELVGQPGRWGDARAGELRNGGRYCPGHSRGDS